MISLKPKPRTIRMQRWFLHMTSRRDWKPIPHPPPGIVLRRSGHPSPEFARFLLTAVGGDWYWTDRYHWSWQRWKTYLSGSGIQVWVFYVKDTPIGYFELRRKSRDVEIALFGLMREFQGKGYGAWTLSEAIRHAWDMESEVARVRLHTCELDHPAALPNYKKLGFRVYSQDECWTTITGGPPGPWEDSGLPVHPDQRFPR